MIKYFCIQRYGVLSTLLIAYSFNASVRNHIGNFGNLALNAKLE